MCSQGCGSISRLHNNVYDSGLIYLIPQEKVSPNDVINLFRSLRTYRKTYWRHYGGYWAHAFSEFLTKETKMRKREETKGIKIIRPPSLRPGPHSMASTSRTYSIDIFGALPQFPSLNNW